MIQWDKIAQSLGHPDAQRMWNALYARYSVAQLAARFAVSVDTVRKQLKFHGVQMKGPGGRNNQKIVIDEDMVLAIRLRGVATVAKERDLDITTVYKALRKMGLNGKCEQIPKWAGQRTTYKRKSVVPEEEPTSSPDTEDAPESKEGT
jgi:hypothetical protein